jgi:hypothetical protein
MRPPKYKVEVLPLGHNVRCTGEMRNAYKNMVEKPKGKRPLGRPKRRCEDNIEWIEGK